MLPLVSFVIPVRNDATRLRRCLATVTANDYPRDLVEILVVDNESTDGSGQVGIEAAFYDFVIYTSMSNLSK